MGSRRAGEGCRKKDSGIAEGEKIKMTRAEDTLSKGRPNLLPLLVVPLERYDTAAFDIHDLEITVVFA